MQLLDCGVDLKFVMILLRRFLLGMLALLLVCSSELAAQERPDLYLLAIAVSDYPDSNIPDLSFSDDDARALVRWAESQRAHLYGDVQTRLLVDSDATRANVVKEMVEFFRPRPP